MSGGRRDDDERFADLVPDAVPLRDRDKLRPPPEPRARPASAREPAPVHLVVEREGGPVLGRGADVSRKIAARLRRGAYRVDRQIDLHGLDAEAAARALRESLADAAGCGERCVLVVHGRGLHSEGDPVLGEAISGWLSAPPLAAGILAFATAPPGQGGSGATLVLLRRAR